MRSLPTPGEARSLHAEGAEDDTEREIQRLEHRPLLDVQLQVRRSCRELRVRVGRASKVYAARSECVGEDHAVSIDKPL